jgi:hypothetical protein
MLLLAVSWLVLSCEGVLPVLLCCAMLRCQSSSASANASDMTCSAAASAAVCQAYSGLVSTGQDGVYRMPACMGWHLTRISHFPRSQG